MDLTISLSRLSQCVTSYVVERVRCDRYDVDFHKLLPVPRGIEQFSETAVSLVTLSQKLFSKYLFASQIDSSRLAKSLQN